MFEKYLNLFIVKYNRIKTKRKINIYNNNHLKKLWLFREEVNSMFEELKTFITVVEYNNFTKAAEVMNMSQPNVSLHIKNLERYFDTTLIVRSHRQKRISITPSGQILYEKAKQILDLLLQTKSELHDQQHVLSGRLRIGASLTIGEYFLPAFLGKFTQQYPDLMLEVAIYNTDEICERVKKLELDVGLIEGVVPTSYFYYENFYEDEMVLAVPYKHPLSLQSFSVEALQQQTWISRETGSGTQKYFQFFLESNQIVPKNLIVLGSNYAVKEAVVNGLGMTFISSYVIEKAVEENELSLVSLSKNYTRQFSYILPKDMKCSKVVEVFIDNLKEYAKEKDE